MSVCERDGGGERQVAGAKPIARGRVMAGRRGELGKALVRRNGWGSRKALGQAIELEMQHGPHDCFYG